MSKDARGDVMDMLEEAMGDVKGTVEELGRVVKLVEEAPTMKDAKIMLDNYSVIKHRHFLGPPGWKGCKRRRTKADVMTDHVAVLLQNGKKVYLKVWRCSDHDTCRLDYFVIRDWHTWYMANGWSGREEDSKPVDDYLPHVKFDISELGFPF